MKNLTKLPRAIITAAAMVVMLLLPLTSKAQNQNDAFFYASDDFTERLPWEFVVVNQQFGMNSDPTPLTSGLLILTMAGAGYAVLKKKED